MATASWRSLVAAAVSVFAASESHAQPQSTAARSIETTVANADLVVVGKLVEIAADEKPRNNEGNEILLVVEETLKQDLFTIDPYERHCVRVSQPLTEVQGWKLRATDCSSRTMTPAPHASTVIELCRASGVIAADFTLLRDPDAALQAAKETVRHMPVAIKRIHAFSLSVPRG